MRKIFLLAMMICFGMASVAMAAANPQKVGVVIIGGVEFKTDDYYKIVKSVIKPLSGAEVVYGNDLQTRYKKYWVSKGFVGEQTPEQEDFMNFAATSGCKKVVYVMITDSVVDQRNSGSHRQQDRVSVQLDAYLCTSARVVDFFAASSEQNSKGSALRARKGAFKKCLEEIGKNLNQQL